MSRLGRLGKGLAVTLIVAAGAWRAWTGPAAPAATPAAQQRGEYLTHHVAMCVACHSPRDDRGELIRNRHFTGAPIPLRSPFPGVQWAARAPDIAGLHGFTDEQIITLLMHGRAAGREPPAPPMPRFGMTREDAEAVLAYLRSL